MGRLLLACWFGFLLPFQSDPLADAKKALQSRDLEVALRLFQEAARQDSGNGEAHYYLALLYSRKGLERETVGHFVKALELLPDEEVIWSEYGKWLLGQRYLTEAERVYRHLARTHPGKRAYWISLGQALYEGGRPVQALESYQRGLGLGRPEPLDYYLAGLAARSLARLDEARANFRKGLALQPGHQELNYQMAELLLQTGALKESLAHWERLGDESGRGRYGRGLALMRLGRLDEAEGHLSQALGLIPDQSRVHYQLGVLYARTGRKEQSDRFFERFRELEQAEREKKKTRVSKSLVKDPGG
ncbi:MAG: tetratricopeptide repeat protein [Acidobacteriota bacterium]